MLLLWCENVLFEINGIFGVLALQSLLLGFLIVKANYRLYNFTVLFILVFIC